MRSMDEAALIGVDWGTSSLRAYAIGKDGTPLDMRASDRGMARLAPDEFEQTLLDMVTGWLPEGQVMPVIACGMVGARQGWVEAPYAPCPGPPLGGRLTRVPTADARIDLRIVPGLAQSDPPDVMRGEETQVAGMMGTEPGFGGALCLPGTHTKWVRVEGGGIARFATCMTGEIFALLAEESILRHSVGTERMDDAAFLRGAEEGLAGDAVLSRLFAVRAGDLLHGTDPAAARGWLSGLLIGTEVAENVRNAEPVAVIGATALGTLYGRVLALAGCEARVLDAMALTVAGLRAAWERDA